MGETRLPRTWHRPRRSPPRRDGRSAGLLQDGDAPWAIAKGQAVGASGHIKVPSMLLWPRRVWGFLGRGKGAGKHALMRCPPAVELLPVRRGRAWWGHPLLASYYAAFCRFFCRGDVNRHSICLKPLCQVDAAL